MLGARYRRRFVPAALLALALLLTAPLQRHGPDAASGAERVPAATLSITATLSPERVVLGSGTIVSGSVEGASGGVELELRAASYPSPTPAVVSHTITAPDGTFAFPALAEERNTRLQVLVAGTSGSASGELQLIVEPRAALAARDLGAGRTQLSVRLTHAAGFAPASVPVHWSVRPRGGSAHYTEAAVTRTRELAGNVTYASVVIDPPSRRFAFRACLNPPWEHAMGTRAQHGRCPAGPLHEGTATGTPLSPYPSAAAIAAAGSFLDARAGRTAFAVMDSSGRISGLRVHEHFESASVIKVMMLTAFLQLLARDHRSISGEDEALLYPMIHISDNEAASAVLARVGEGALERVAREAGMSDYAPGVGWWAFSQTSAIDQVRLFTALPKLIPERFYGYARYLLATIEPSQSWGIPPVARPSWQVFFKTGALPSQGLFNEAARLERGPVTFAVAVFTDGDPSMAYGEETIAGVGRALLSRAP